MRRLLAVLTLCVAASAYGQSIVVNELTTYFVDLTFYNENRVPTLPTTLQFSIYDRESQKLLTPWREVTPALTCPGTPAGCVTLEVPAAENLFVGRCKTRGKACVVDADCGSNGPCRAKIEAEQQHTVTADWTWASGSARDRLNVNVRNLEFWPEFTATSTPTNTPTATPTRTPTATP